MKYYCHSTLKEISRPGYSSAAEKRLAGSQKRFPFILSYEYEDLIELRIEQVKKISISGVQEKASLRFDHNDLVKTEHLGEYILKPVPGTRFRLQEDIPANEHLTMQIAEQIFKIPTAVNACVSLADGQLAYITKRFDRVNGEKILQEDFCQLSAVTKENSGENYKYESSYENIGALVKQYCPAYSIEIRKLFKQILFNYIFSNGDAHLKNFSLLQSKTGDYIFTPAYDLLCTALHLENDSQPALDLFNDYESDFYKANAFFGEEDFLRLGELYSIKVHEAKRYLSEYDKCKLMVEDMVKRSFLSPTAKAGYIKLFYDKLRIMSLV